MNMGDSEKRTEIWLKYCEECIKTKIDAIEDILNTSLMDPPKKSKS
jgi:hypothetical protein